MASKISPASLNDALKKQDPIFIVDVREPLEYRREHIAQAHLYPLGSLNPDAIFTAAGRDATICVTCAAGSRSAKACQALSDALAKSKGTYGSTKLYDLTGGMSAWRLAGLPVVEDRKAPLPIIRQVHMIAGTLIISGSLLTRFYNHNFFALPLFVGCGLFVAGSTGFCGMAAILQLLPYNREHGQCSCG